MTAKICLLLGAALVGQPPADAKKVAAELRGAWRLEAVRNAEGESMLPEPRPSLLIEGDRLLYGGEEVARLAADSATDPKIFDLRFRGPDRGYEGIYRLDKDELKICLNGRSEGAKERPSGFSPEGQADWRVLTLTRIKPSEVGPGSGFVGLMLGLDGESKAVVVQSVLEGTPAKAAGLRKGDVLLDVAGAAASNLNTAVSAVRRAKPKSELILRVRRDGAEREIKVKVGLLPLAALLGLE
jgi:uncharacterized protein (TIGR03067 family)